MAREKQHVFSARTTEEGLKLKSFRNRGLFNFKFGRAGRISTSARNNKKRGQPQVIPGTIP